MDNKSKNSLKKSIAVIGGGASGCMAAYAAAQNGGRVVLFEKNEKLGKKLYISGKGRCNVSNDAQIEDFLLNVVRGQKFVQSALRGFDVWAVRDFFSHYNCPLKTTRGGRIFPVSDKSSDILKALKTALEGLKIDIRYGCNIKAQDIEEKNGEFFVLGECFNSLIVALGGLSYPATGSTGEGYKIAKKFSHSIVDLRPSLTEVILHDNVAELMGLSLKNVALKASYLSKEVFYEQGEMLFTQKGISGPLVLSLSAYINRLDLKNVDIRLDLKPALDEKTLDARILRDFNESKGRIFKNSLSNLLPKSLVSFIIEASKIDPLKQVDHITAEERARLLSTLKSLKLSARSLAPIEQCVVTSGGVSLDEVNPKTMESKYIGGLFFSGELLDIDALTGGFNIQLAFSTGYAAGKAAAQREI